MPDHGFGHVEGLALNPGEDLVHALSTPPPTAGVFRLTPSGPQRVADHYREAMGSTITGPDAFPVSRK